jgi:hypothetical protein
MRSVESGAWDSGARFGVCLVGWRSAEKRGEFLRASGRVRSARGKSAQSPRGTDTVRRYLVWV